MISSELTIPNKSSQNSLFNHSNMLEFSNGQRNFNRKDRGDKMILNNRRLLLHNQIVNGFMQVKESTGCPGMRTNLCRDKIAI